MADYHLWAGKSSLFCNMPKCIQENPLLMVNDLVLWAITATKGRYDARTRYIIRHITWKLQIKYEDMEGVEELFVDWLRSNSEKEKR